MAAAEIHNGGFERSRELRQICYEADPTQPDDTNRTLTHCRASCRTEMVVFR